MPLNEDNPVERKYSIWNALVLSFYSRDLYADVGRAWKGTGYVYLVLILAIVSFFYAVDFQFAAIDKVPGFAEKVPEFQIVNGQFSTSALQPYIWGSSESAIVFDTTGKIKTLDQIPGAGEMGSFLLVTKTQVLTRRHRFGQTEEKTFELAKCFFCF